MSVQDYTAVIKVLETRKYTTFRPKTNLTLNRKFELYMGESREISARISQKAINIDTLL
jgi:hypothetical protein